MGKVEMWFPTCIYVEENLINKEENAKLIEHSLGIKDKTPSGGADWLGGTYNTHGTHDLTNDPVFAPLLELVTRHVNEFAAMHNCEGTYKNDSAWLNISDDKAWQEFHTHNGAVFSAVFYMSAPEGSGKIIFESPLEPDMFGLKKIKEKNPLSFTRISYTPEPAKLLIFRSWLRHMVEPGKNTTPRISIAMNFS